MSARLLAIDWRVLNFLQLSMTPGYNPAADNSDDAAERVAILRCCICAACFYLILPSLMAEIEGLPIVESDIYGRIPCLQTSCPKWDPAPETVEQRTKELLIHHVNEKNCRLVAEAERAQVEALLTSDRDLIRDLRGRCAVSLARPGDFWRSLGIPKDAMPVWVPSIHSYLGEHSWWRVGTRA
jgi:hypothetical protein